MKSRISRRAQLVALLTVLAVAIAAVVLSETTKKSEPTRLSTPPELTATVNGPGQVALTSNGHPVTRLHSGVYTVLVTVDSSNADFHLTGPGVDHTTGAHFVGLALWGVHFVKGTYSYTDNRSASARMTTHVISVY
jgi:hypothetical protein